MTDLLQREPVSPQPTVASARRPTRLETVWLRRVLGVLIVALPLAWAIERAIPDGGPGDIVNTGGLRLVDDLLAKAFSPALDATFLDIVFDATIITLSFAALGTAGALVLGLVGGLVLSDVAWSHTPPAPVRALRLLLRGVLVAIRSIHELIWALLFVSVLGLDPIAAVLAIALPFGAQTAQVFGESFDSLPRGPVDALRTAGARKIPALAYGLLPSAWPLMLSYSFYRFECAIRSSVILGVVGVGGLGQELAVSLSSRNWDEVWTLIGAVLILSALVDAWSSRLRTDMAVASCSDWAVTAADDTVAEAGTDATNSPSGDGAVLRRGHGTRSRWAAGSAVVVLPALVAAWFASGVSWAGLTSERTRLLTGRLADDMTPPALPPGGFAEVQGATFDTVAMAIVAMALAVVLTVLIGPWATAPRNVAGQQRSWASRALRNTTWWLARALLLVLRSIPPTVWAIVALLALFPGILPGALALGLYTGGILGRLVAEAWENIDPRARDALRHNGVSAPMAAMAAIVPPSTHQFVTYTLYRFEICIRDTAIVGVVGAAGLGALIDRNLDIFRYDVVASLLVASFAVSVASEVVSRRLRKAIRA